MKSYRATVNLPEGFAFDTVRQVPQEVARIYERGGFLVEVRDSGGDAPVLDSEARDALTPDRPRRSAR